MSYTRLFYSEIISTLQQVKVQQTVANLYKTSVYKVRSIMEHAVSLGTENRALIPRLTSVSIDEKAFASGHEYATILIDNNTNTVLEMVEGRDKANTKALFNLVTDRDTFPELTRVNMDMWRPFIDTVKEIAPNAKITHDMFHLIEKLSKAIDKTRKKEVKEYDVLKKAKYTVLKNKENRTEKQQTVFETINALNLNTAKAWQIRENFKSIKQLSGYNMIYAAYMEWVEHSKAFDIKPVLDVINTFERHREGIINSFYSNTSSAKHENKNGMIQSILAKARGFRNFERFRINVLFYFGNLNFSLNF
jgi:transposase